MTSHYSRLHIPLSKWRLHLLADLFTATDPQLLIGLRVLHPRYPSQRHIIHCRRSYGIEPGRHEKARDFRAKLAANDESSGDVLRNSASPQLRHRHRQQKFDPYSDSNRQDLAKLVSELQYLTQEVKSDAAKTRSARLEVNKLQNPDNASSEETAEVRQSPIQKRFVSRRLRDIPKARPSREQTALAHDPWAKMLASPVRLCHGSYSRLPMRLLTNWTFMRDSEHNTYLMPSEIAGLDDVELDHGTVEWKEQKREENRASRLERYQQRLKDEDQIGKHERSLQDGESKEIVAVTSEEVKQSPQPFTPSSAFPGNEPAIRIMPYSNLLSEITDKLNHQVYSKKAIDEGRGSMPGSIERLVPYRWRERISTAQHFERHREQVEAATGQKDFRPALAEAQIDLKTVRWPENIESKMLEMLRHRVLSALRRMLHANSSNHAIKLRRVAAMPVPNGNETNVSPELLEDETVDVDNAPLVSPIAKPQIRALSLHDYQPLAARFFMHMGEAPLPTTFPFIAKSQLLVPPLLTHPTTHQSFPVFSLRDMLGPERYSDLLELVGLWPIIQPPNNPARGKTSQNNEDWLILVRVKQAYTEVLLSELWRLWRYRGGRRGEGISGAP